ncbi:MAG: sugar ABC transporter permease [Treponema sp.]|jgi:putative multiple sugar transport system permease protein|nr:sugar ABC transporter permease [Treponema sp.]
MSNKDNSNVTLGVLIKNNIRNYSMFLMLVIIMIVFAGLTRGVNIGSRNFTYIFIQYSYVLILAVGMVQVIIIGGIDLSVGAVCAFIGAVSANVYNTGIGIFPTILISLVIGGAIGAFQGALIAYVKIPAFIVTLAGMLLFRGLTYIYTNVNPIGLRDDGYKEIASGVFNIPSLEIQIGGTMWHMTALLVGVIIIVGFIVNEIIARNRKIANNFDYLPMHFFILKIVLISLFIFGLSQRFATYRGLPKVVIVLAITVFVFHFIMKNTVMGRYIYAVGGNARSAKLSGINSEFVNVVVFCFMGILAGLAAVVSTGYMNSALPQAGNLFEMDAIASCYIGGVSASGGIGTVIGVVVGGLVMSAINNGMILMNIGTDWQYVVKAAVCLFAVFYDVFTRRRSGLG